MLSRTDRQTGELTGYSSIDKSTFIIDNSEIENIVKWDCNVKLCKIVDVDDNGTTELVVHIEASESCKLNAEDLIKTIYDRINNCSRIKVVPKYYKVHDQIPMINGSIDGKKLREDKDGLSYFSTCGKIICYNSLKTEQVINLMNVYLSEWSHRDSSMWKQIYVYYLTAAIVMLLPYIKPMGLTLPTSFPSTAFFILGIFLSIFVMFVACLYAYRMVIVRNAYIKTMKMLPKYYWQVPVDEQKYHILNWLCKKTWVSVIICMAAGIILVIFGFVLMVY